jgi:hypothetical protein
MPPHSETDEEIVPEMDESEAQAYDCDLIMRCLADKVLTESRLKISIYDFGGQSVFNVSVAVIALEIFLNFSDCDYTFCAL